MAHSFCPSLFLFGCLLGLQDSILFTVFPSPTPYARHLGDEAPTSPHTRRLSFQALFSRPIVSPPPGNEAELEIEEEDGAVPGSPKKLRLKRTASKGFKDFPLFIEVSFISAFRFPSLLLSRSVLRADLCELDFCSLLPPRTNLSSPWSSPSTSSPLLDPISWFTRARQVEELRSQRPTESQQLSSSLFPLDLKDTS